MNRVKISDAKRRQYRSCLSVPEYALCHRFIGAWNKLSSESLGDDGPALWEITRLEDVQVVPGDEMSGCVVLRSR